MSNKQAQHCESDIASVSHLQRVFRVHHPLQVDHTRYTSTTVYRNAIVWSNTFSKFTLNVGNGFTLSLAGSWHRVQAIYTYKEASDLSVKKRYEIVKPVFQQNGHFTDPAAAY